MPLDAICLSALTRELQDKLEGAKIDKIQQPERDMVLFSLRGRGENLKLLLAAGTGNARVHLTKASFENPAEPPMFCMLLRKYLIGARILGVSQPAYERILHFELETRDELGLAGHRTLVAELIGRSANLILVDADGRILDCMRRTDFAGDELRRMQPGMFYRDPPKQAKPALLACGREEILAQLEKADKGSPIEKWLLDSFAGELRPCLYYDGNRPRDFSFLRLTQYGDALRCEEAESFSALLDSFYSGRDRLEQQRRRSHELLKTVRTLRDREQRKLAARYAELQKSEDRETIRKTAELITANLYRIKKGDRVLRCEDYYEPDCPEIEIALDPLKTPQQNAAALFKNYNKRKAANAHLTTLIEEGEARLDYLNSVLELINAAESEKDLSELRRELVDTGYIKESRGKKREKAKPQAPLRFLSSDGREILVGRSNLQNDELSTKLGRRTDLWLHTQKIHGSHVLIRCEGEQPGERCIEEAATIAAYYSQGRGAGKIPVDYTMLKNVRKPSGSLPGKVIYTEYKTILVESDEELVKRLKK